MYKQTAVTKNSKGQKTHRSRLSSSSFLRGYWYIQSQFPSQTGIRGSKWTLIGWPSVKLVFAERRSRSRVPLLTTNAFVQRQKSAWQKR